jgi:saccharopine dehydrogenase (NADP+, L-glutamate forming)
MHALKAIGLYDKTEVPGLALEDVHGFLVRAFPDGQVTEAAVRKLMANRGVRDVDSAMEAVRWLGLFQPTPGKLVAPKKPVAAIDALCKLLEERLQYKEGEKDMVAMFHTVTGELPDGTVEAHTSRLLAFGTPGGDTAMSATVGYTTAAGAELVLQHMQASTLAHGADAAVPTGVIIPIQASVYEPILKRISDFGITWTEDILVSQQQRK